MAYSDRTLTGPVPGLGTGMGQLAYFILCGIFHTTRGRGKGKVPFKGKGMNGFPSHFCCSPLKERYFVIGSHWSSPSRSQLQCECFGMIVSCSWSRSGTISHQIYHDTLNWNRNNWCLLFLSLILNLREYKKPIWSTFCFSGKTRLEFTVGCLAQKNPTSNGMNYR